MSDIAEELLIRAKDACELCENKNDLHEYHVEGALPPEIVTCGGCYSALSNENFEASYWQFLSNAMWSEMDAVKIVSWRVLDFFASAAWAKDLLDIIYLEDDVLTAAKASRFQEFAGGANAPTKDSNGAILANGDTVILIKDLPVKGAGFTAKRGTTVRGISLTENPDHIEGRVNGTKVVLVSAYLKKSS